MSSSCPGSPPGIAVGVELEAADAALAQADEPIELARVGVDEDRDVDLRRRQTFDGSGHRSILGVQIEAALGGDLFGSFRHQGDLVRTVLQGEIQHLVTGGHLEVELAGDDLAQSHHVAVLDMAAILSLVDGDADGTGLFCQASTVQRVGIGDTTGLAKGCHMIDVDTEGGHHASSAGPISPRMTAASSSASARTNSSSGPSIITRARGSVPL